MSEAIVSPVLLLVLGLPLLVWGGGALYLLVRRLRHSLLDFCVLVWTTGGLMGLTALGLPRGVGLAGAFLAAGVVGFLAFGGGVLGLAAANAASDERPAARALLQLRGMLFLPALAGLLALPLLAGGGILALTRGEGGGVAFLALGGAAVGLLLAWHGWRFLRLLKRKAAPPDVTPPPASAAPIPAAPPETAPPPAPAADLTAKE